MREAWNSPYTHSDSLTNTHLLTQTGTHIYTHIHIRTHRRSRSLCNFTLYLFKILDHLTSFLVYFSYPPYLLPQLSTKKRSKFSQFAYATAFHLLFLSLPSRYLLLVSTICYHLRKPTIKVRLLHMGPSPPLASSPLPFPPLASPSFPSSPLPHPLSSGLSEAIQVY